MVSFKTLSLLAINAAPFLSGVSAHPGEVMSSLSVKRQAAAHMSIAARGAQKLARCASNTKVVEARKRAIARRAAKVEALRARKAKRDASTIQAYDYSHNYTGSVSQDEAFTVNTSCILQPQLTIGPYWVSGELIRSDLVDGQEGLAMELELEFIDTSTCEPVSGLYIDIWNANSTGIYSGIKESSLDSTYLRGIQVTDDDGTVTFDTLVPGHYDGRASHTHVMVHQNVTVYSNNTYAVSSGTVRSISQLFYDTEFRAAVEETSPYSTNTNAITTNEEDALLAGVTLGDYDPFLKYIYVGDVITDGVFAWHSIGIDTSADYDSNESAASAYYATGGVDESGSSSFGGSSGSGPGGSNSTGSFNGTGGAPSGVAAVSGSQTGSFVTISGTPSLSSSSTTYSVATQSSNAGAVGSKGGWFWHSKPTGSLAHPHEKPSELRSGESEKPSQTAEPRTGESGKETKSADATHTHSSESGKETKSADSNHTHSTKTATATTKSAATEYADAVVAGESTMAASLAAPSDMPSGLPDASLRPSGSQGPPSPPSDAPEHGSKPPGLPADKSGHGMHPMPTGMSGRPSGFLTLPTESASAPHADRSHTVTGKVIESKSHSSEHTSTRA